MNNRQILETLKMQPLSEEEKSAKHILGRLYGPIATSNEGTRNGRKYNKELWEKALNDDIFKEKLATKSLFLELGHPTDREETDMTKVCACIPEMPRIVNGDLYAYVDILDTPNGRLLKTFCDYGFVPGISSRGSGDIMENNEVDPETFFLETFDIVQLPAVKDARLAMCEGLDTKALKLRRALHESLDAASDEDKKIMKETLDNLDIVIEDEEIQEDVNEEASFEVEIPSPIVEEKEEVSIEVKDIKDLEKDEEVEKTDSYTVKDLVKELKEYDDGLDVEFKPIEIDGVEYPVEMLGFDDSEDGKLVVSIGYSQEIGDNIDSEEEVVETEDEVSEEEVSEEPVEETEEAEDNGDEEVIESLKEMIRQKDMLESEIKDLKSEKTVSDAEVKELKEELDKYKTAFTRISGVASKTRSLEKDITTLNEQLKLKDKEIDNLKHERSVKLNESVNKENAQIKTLTEQLRTSQNEVEEKEKQLDEQANTYRAKINESVKVARAFKNKCDAITNKYIEFRASMLGVRPAEITSKLTENFSIEDVDKACETILTESVSIGTINVNRNSKLKITEQKSLKNSVQDDDLESLYELAGLK